MLDVFTCLYLAVLFRVMKQGPAEEGTFLSFMTNPCTLRKYNDLTQPWVLYYAF